ncbi:MAG: PQQ-binding-like beta-propeller repeat protein [Flavobacteriales bacterium]|nr:PQQ-binding-like beta-propeller repeat protein [Flavobacteriales bacterium]
MKIKIILIALAVFLTNSIAAQDVLWEKTFEKEANFIDCTPAGVAIVGTDEALFGIDGDGNILWENEKLKKVEKERVEQLKGSELIYVTDKGMLSKNRIINVYTGDEYVNYEEVTNIFGAMVLTQTNSFIATDGTNLRCFDIATKEQKWVMDKKELPFGVKFFKVFPEKTLSPVTLKGNQDVIYTSESTGIMHLGLAQLGEYDLNTGTPKWKFDFKPFKLKKPGEKGDSPSAPGSGFAIMQLDRNNNVLYFPFRDQLLAINASTGATLWEPKANKFKSMVKDMYVTKKGVLVLVGGAVPYIQMIDFKTGTEIWEKPIKIKGGAEALILEDGDDYYSVSKKYLIKLDIDKGVGTPLTDKIKFNGNESFTDMSIYDKSIVLSANQNIVGIDKSSGNINYQHYFKPPGGGLGTLAQNIVLAAVAAASTMHSYSHSRQQAVANNASSFTYTQYTPQYISRGGARTLESEKSMFISTKITEGPETGFGLLRINKETGDIIDRVVVGDREPIYDVDESAGRFYYKSSKKSIACRSIKKK